MHSFIGGATGLDSLPGEIPFILIYIYTCIHVVVYLLIFIHVYI